MTSTEHRTIPGLLASPSASDAPASPGESDRLDRLDQLEAESVHIFREVAATFRKPVLLFSGGKDSVVMAHLARKAFWPAPVPFPLMHVDTGHNFDEVIEFRDRVVAHHGHRLVIEQVQDDIDAGRVVEEFRPDGFPVGRNRLQTVTLKRGIADHGFDAVFGGARRDEEKARAKERVFSFRDRSGGWNPRAQRPELWNLYNGRHGTGEHIRVFPLSNWTEHDIWAYIAREDDGTPDGLQLPSLYYAHDREVVERDGMLLAVNRWLQPTAEEIVRTERVRFRTIGDATCTGCVESTAATNADVVAEVAASRLTERGATRADDRISDSGMEERKKEGYF